MSSLLLDYLRNNSVSGKVEAWLNVERWEIFTWANFIIALVSGLATVAGFAIAVKSGWIEEIFPAHTRFYCSNEPDPIGGGKVWTVMYRIGKEQPKPWLKMITTLGDDYTPLRRCEIIAERLETYREDGLTTLTYEKDSDTNQYVICVKTKLTGENGCPLLLTLKPGVDPYLTLRQMAEARLLGQGVYQDSQGLSGTSFSPESPVIDLESVLAEDDR